MTETKSDRWLEPRVTGNAAMLAGYLCGALSRLDERLYRVSNLIGDDGPIIENIDPGDLYRLRVDQISGTE